MILFNIPIKVSHIPIIITDWLRNSNMRQSSIHKDAKFSFVYFSYQPDFPYLSVSLKSLAAAVDPELIRNVVLFVDQKAPFSDEEREYMNKLCPKLIFETVTNFSWASTETTLAEIESFKKVTELTEKYDFIVKVDSDIVWFRNKKLPRLLRSKYQAVGDGHHLNYEYAQGGLYMIRQHIVKAVFDNITPEIIKRCEEQCGTAGEDMVLSTLLDNRKSPFYLTRLMLFPDEYRLVSGINRCIRWEFCAAHFVKDKDSMAKFYDSLNKLS